MKAVVVEERNVLRVRDIPVPEMGDYDALCEILYGTTCTSTDSHVIDGGFPWPIAYPTILGHESIGRVVKVGPKVRTFKPGDLITRVGTHAVPEMGLDINWGGFAEYGIARDHFAMAADGGRPEEWQSYRFNQLLPPTADPAAATMMITWRETYSYSKRIGMPAARRVLIIGTGGVGLAYVAHARNFGAEEIIVVGSPSREPLFRKAGATGVTDYRLDPQVLIDSSGRGYDLMVDAIGNADTADRYLPAVADGGAVAIYGLDDYHNRVLTLGRSRGKFTYFDHGGYDEASAHEEVTALFMAGKLDARLWMDLDHPYALEEIEAAYQAVAARKAVKALVKVSSGGYDGLSV